MIKIGMHISPADLIQREVECRKQFKVIQIFLGSPQTLLISKSSREFLEKYSKIFDIYAHAPFLINLVNVSHRMYEKSIDFLTEVTTLGKYGLKGIVTHLGKLYTKAEYESGEVPSKIHGDKSLYDALQRLRPFYERVNMNLYLENSVGNDIGSSLDSVGYLVQKIRQVQSLNIKLCLDTEHAYAAGDPSIGDERILRAFRNEIGLIHFNAMEEGVVKGNRKDRHSKTTFDICSQFQVEDYLNFMEEFKDKAFIFERGKSIDLGITDANILRSGRKQLFDV